MMQLQTQYPGPGTTQIPFRQLTYLQFCILPSLFHKHIDILASNNEYPKMGDIFIMYAQTLFQLIPLPLGEDKNTSRLGFVGDSILGRQMLGLLRYVMGNIRVDCVELIFSKNVHHCLYSLLAGQLMDDVMHHQEASKYYFGSLGDYFKMLEIEDDIRKNRKFINPSIMEREIQDIIQKYNKNPLSHTTKPTPYTSYLKKYHKLAQKLQYIFKSQPKTSTNNETPQMGIQPIAPKATPLPNIHLNTFYPKCLTPKQKLIFISKIYDRIIRSGKLEARAVEEVELMCLLYLEEMRNNQMGAKLEIYLLLAAIKVWRSGSTEGLMEELRLIFSFGQLPSISYIFPLISSIISLPPYPTNTNTNTATNTPASQLLDLVLKSYSRPHPTTPDPMYIRLMLISSLYLHSRLAPTAMKSGSRKLQLEKLCEFGDVVGYFNSLDLVDYFLGLLWMGKEVRVFGEAIWHRMDANSIGHMFGADIQGYLRQYLTKTQCQDSDQPPLQLPPQKLHTLLLTLLQKRTQLTSPLSPAQYFHNQLLSLILHTNGCTKFTPATVRECLGILEEYGVVGGGEKVVRLLMVVLGLGLEAGRAKRQALLCYLLGMESESDKINWNAVQNYIGAHQQQFSRIPAPLFSLIPNYNLIEILVQRYAYQHPHPYIQMMNEWIGRSQNYRYTWPDVKREKVLLGKRVGFVRYLLAAGLGKGEEKGEKEKEVGVEE